MNKDRLVEVETELRHLENTFRTTKDYYVAKVLAREISRLRCEHIQISALIQVEEEI